MELDVDGGGEFEDELDEDSQEADNRVREEFATRFRGKEKVSSVPVDVFLTALSSIERKMKKSFSALYREIEEGDLLEEAWPTTLSNGLRDNVARSSAARPSERYCFDASPLRFWNGRTAMLLAVADPEFEKRHTPRPTAATAATAPPPMTAVRRSTSGAAENFGTGLSSISAIARNARCISGFVAFAPPFDRSTHCNWRNPSGGSRPSIDIGMRRW